MAKAKEVKDMTPTTLVFEHMFTPYRKGDVATFPKYQADKILEAERKGDDGEQLPPAARLFVRGQDDDLLAPYAEVAKAEAAPAADAKASKA